MQAIDGQNYLIAYTIRGSTEKKSSTIQKEYLAVIWTTKKLRLHSEGYFKVITDPVALKWLHNLKTTTCRLERWALKL